MAGSFGIARGAVRMVSSPELPKFLVCSVLLVAGFLGSKGKPEELTQARTELEVALGEAAQAAPPEQRRPAKLTFLIHGYERANEAMEFGPLKAEFEKRGYSCKIIRSPRTKTKTPNQDRAKVMVEALKGVEGDIVLVGISNQGLFMPLVAAEHPIRRIVMINAVVPTPGKSFREAFDFKEVFATEFASKLAQVAPGMSEVCPLKKLPTVEYAYVCGEKDDAVRPQWEQWAAREYLHVEPVVIKGAGHANIVSKYVKEVVGAATKGL
jgi:pimeloyl-ACP methyl ester carboxylesterase